MRGGTKGDFNYVADAAAFLAATFTTADSRNITICRCNERESHRLDAFVR